MTDITNIPLNKLTAWEGNVRKTQNKAFIEELAASIMANGPQQNPVVRKQGRKSGVVAGGQRLKALNLLAETGAIDSSHPVPCKIADGEIDASQISKAQILDALREGRNSPPAPAWEKLQKPDLAALAEREICRTPWLRPPLG